MRLPWQISEADARAREAKVVDDIMTAAHREWLPGIDGQELLRRLERRGYRRAELKGLLPALLARRMGGVS